MNSEKKFCPTCGIEAYTVSICEPIQQYIESEPIIKEINVPAKLVDECGKCKDIEIRKKVTVPSELKPGPTINKTKLATIYKCDCNQNDKFFINKNEECGCELKRPCNKCNRKLPLEYGLYRGEIPEKFGPRTFGPRTFGPREFDPRRYSPREFDSREFTPQKYSPRQFDARQFDPRRYSPRTTPFLSNNLRRDSGSDSDNEHRGERNILREPQKYLRRDFEKKNFY